MLCSLNSSIACNPWESFLSFRKSLLFFSCPFLVADAMCVFRQGVSFVVSSVCPLLLKVCFRFTCSPFSFFLLVVVGLSSHLSMVCNMATPF